MTKSRVIVLVAVIAAAISVWWWRRSRGEEPASAAAVTQPTTAGPATVARPAAPATARLRVSVRDAKDVGIELVLAPGGKPLTGVVTDATGGPIAGARVDAAGLDRIARASDAVATTMTGSDGSYRLTVAMGQLLVGVSNPDYAPQARYVDVGDASHMALAGAAAPEFTDPGAAAGPRAEFADVSV